MQLQSTHQQRRPLQKGAGAAWRGATAPAALPRGLRAPAMTSPAAESPAAAPEAIGGRVKSAVVAATTALVLSGTWAVAPCAAASQDDAETLGLASANSLTAVSATAATAALDVAPPPAATSPTLTAPDASACPYGLCPGEVDGTLNTCALAAPSCVSVMSDDGQHFLPPWSYDTAAAGGPAGALPYEEGAAAAEARREAAVARLLDVATGGKYEPGLSTDLYVTNGYSRVDAASYQLRGALAAVTGGPSPERPRPQLDARGFRPFDGALQDRHTTGDGSIYLRIRFGGSAAAGGDIGSGGGGATGGGHALDAEFIFPAGDNIVNVRCADAESGPQAGGEAPAGRLSLSFERGVAWDANEARRQMESLRKALRWEVVPVVADFDPKFNANQPLWFERLYEPFRATKFGRFLIMQ